MPAGTTLYLITKTDGQNAFVIQPDTFDGFGGVQQHTDLTLYGTGTPNWGDQFDVNFYRMLEHFAAPAYTSLTIPGPVPFTQPFQPENANQLGNGNGINFPIEGQIWYNQTTNQLFVARGIGSPNGPVQWSPVTSVPVVTAASPTSLTTASGGAKPFAPTPGDLIFNTGTTPAGQLQVWTGSAWSSGGDVSSVTGGSGILANGVSGVPQTGNVTISLASSSGTVTSVALANGDSNPSDFTITGSPITTAGTITITLNAELQGLANPAGTGLMTRVAAGSYTQRSLVVGTASILSVSNASGVSGNPTLNYSGTALPIANGGTAATTALAAFNNLSPTTTTGDMIYRSGANNVRLPIGTANQVLTVVGGIPTWFNTSGVTYDHVANGYDTLPSGLIIQWGSFTYNPGSTTTINFPKVFPHAAFSVTTTQPMSTMYGYPVNAIIISTSQWQFISDGGSAVTIYWMAIGF